MENDWVEPVLVNRNDLVTILYDHHGISITVQAKAMSNGIRNDSHRGAKSHAPTKSSTPASWTKGAWFMMNKFIFTRQSSASDSAKSSAPTRLRRPWARSGATRPAPAPFPRRPATSIYSDPLAHAVGDLITIVVDLQNTVTKDQNTTTAKTTSVDGTISSLVYPTDATNHGWNFTIITAKTRQRRWNSAQIV